MLGLMVWLLEMIGRGFWRQFRAVVGFWRVLRAVVDLGFVSKVAQWSLLEGLLVNVVNKITVGLVEWLGFCRNLQVLVVAMLSIKR